MKKTIYLALLLLAVMAGMSSCLDNGDETFALERGDFETLIADGWTVESSKLYNPLTGDYHSDLINGNLVGYSMILGGSGNSVLISPDGESNSLTWMASEDNDYLSLNGTRYNIESLGKQLMVLSQNVTVNGENYILKYYLKKSEIEADNPGDNVISDDQTYVVSTDQYGYFSNNGYGFHIPVGAVPNGDSGTAGSIAFSSQNVEINNLPGNPPSGVTFVPGSAIFANPINFIFATPIIIDVAMRGQSLSNTSLYHWNAYTQNWDAVSFSAINANGTASASVIELGYFVLGTTDNKSGGIRIKKSQFERGYYYYLSVTPVEGGNTINISYSPSGQDLYMTDLPLTTYNAQITREKRTQLQNGAVSIETSRSNFRIVIDRELVKSGNSLSSFSGWTNVNLSDIEWDNGRPEAWGDATVTYGTGFFQATLNWVNQSNQTTDYDLHLTTPSGTEIYFAHKNGNGFELDRDVISSLGTCVENIYTINDNIERGTYVVRVHHYSGATGKPYSCRVILGGRVVASYTGITNSGFQTIYTFTVQ